MYRSVSVGMKKFHLSKTEIILKTIPRYADIDKFEKIYNGFLYEINKKGAIQGNIVKLPFKSFIKFPKSTIERVIKSSYEILKYNRKINQTSFYNSVLANYLIHDIDCDIPVILKDMKNYKVQFDDLTYSLLIDLYCERGDMIKVEALLKVMENKKINCSENVKHVIYGGYIRAKKFDIAKQYIIKENLKEKNNSLLLQKCRGFADIDYFKELMETLNLIKTSNFNLSTNEVLNLYMRLIEAMASDSELNEILDMANTNYKYDIVNLIFILNSKGFYNHALTIMLKFDKNICKEITTNDLIKSFCTRDCPINIYISVLEIYIGRTIPNVYLNLFAIIDFDTALKFSEKIMNKNNAQCIFSNLLIKVINDESIGIVSRVLQLMEDKLLLLHFHTIIQNVLIPGMLTRRIISKPNELLKHLPNMKKQILPPLLMYNLCKGDFDSFDKLLNVTVDNYPLNYLNFSKRTAQNILNNVPFKEIKKVITVTSKVFSPQFVNWLIGSIVMERIIQVSINDDTTAINEAISIAQDFGVTYGKKDLEYLEMCVPKYQHLFSEFKVIGGISPDDSLVDEEHDVLH